MSVRRSVRRQAVLVKGSRFMQMERVVRSFEDSTAEA